MIKKKILHLYTELNISCGVSNSIKLICKNSKKYTHLIVTFGGNAVNLMPPNCHVINLKKKYSPTLINAITDSIKLIYICKKYHIDILHSHHRYFDLISYLIKKILKVRTFTTVRSIVEGKKKLSYKSQHLFAISNFVAHHLTNYYNIDKNRITIINNFLDPTEVKINSSKEQILNKLGIEENSFIFGYFGRIDFHEKAIDKLIISFNRIVKSENNVSLILIGDGPDFYKAKEYVIDNNKIKLFNGKNDIHNYYQILDCFVLPSIDEPFGNVLLEAGFHKIPIIANNCGGIPEIIEHKIHGLLFEKNDFKDLERMVIKLLSNEVDIYKITESFSKRVNSNYNVLSKISELEKGYEQKS